MPMIETRDGTRLYVKSWGDGPPVILIHGWPLSGDSWDPLSHALAEQGFRAIAYDRRGFGRSDQPSGGYDYDTFADDLASVIDTCAEGEQVALVGFSMGGGEIARYLSRHGAARVERVALISSVVPLMREGKDNPDGVPQEVFDTMTEGMLQDRAHFMAGFFRQFYGVGLIDRPVSDEMLRLSWATAMQAGLRPTLLSAQAFATTDFRGDLPSFSVPTLVIHGTSDKTVPIEATGRAVARAVPPRPADRVRRRAAWRLRHGHRSAQGGPAGLPDRARARARPGRARPDHPPVDRHLAAMTGQPGGNGPPGDVVHWASPFNQKARP